MFWITQHEFEKLLREQRETNHLLREILSRLARYTIRVSEVPMAIGNIQAGTTGQFAAVLMDNGQPFVIPTGSQYVFTPTFTVDDTSATVTPATTDATGGTIPLAQQAVVTIPATDTVTSITVTVTAVDPTGATQTGTLTVPVTGAPQQFTIVVSQVA